MTVRDLGALDGPLLIFGGPYSNLHATRALMAAAAAHDIPADRVICTGDVVAYAADPAATTDAIMDWGIPVVMGNCEESFGNETDDCGCGFDEGTACDLLSRQWYAYANARLRPDHRAWKRALPTRIEFTFAGRRFAVVHGSASSINEFVFERTDDAVKRAGLNALGADAVIGGHCGVPFTQILDGRLWHNAGVIGMPANDGTPRVWYSLLSETDGGIAVTLHALDYDHAAAAQAMRDNGLPEGYASCLETGLWPNMDVMPAAERVHVGAPLKPGTTIWPGPARNAAE